MTKHSPNDTIAAWLETIAAEDAVGEKHHTVLPGAGSQQPLLASFQSFRDTNSAAPIDVGATIAEGGMGIIKVAKQAALGRTVVVKTLRSNYAAQAAEHVLREAWATGALEHPNIVPVHDIRTDELGSPMIILKRIEGETWTTLMHNPELIREKFGATKPIDWNTEILRQVTQAVRFSHSRGILHRDLKPDNVMIGAFGEVYLVDWGIAMSLPGNNSTRLPAAEDADEMAGTPCYMAPEMLGGSPLDERTDIYLLGAILFEILAGRPPHSLDSLENLLADINKSEPSFPDDACPLLSALCTRAMRADPKERFTNASEFATALSESRSHRDSADIAEVAHEQVLQLETELAEQETSRHEIYTLFGALRLGFGEALKMWPENESAQEGLEHASTELIAYELAEENPQAALTLYKGLSHPEPSLGERIDKALVLQAKERAELEKFRADSDDSVGQRTRIFVMIFLGLLWTASPLVRYLSRGTANMMTYNELIAGTVGFMIINLALHLWGRESLTKTAINRKMGRAIFAVFPLQIVLLYGCSLLQISPTYSAPLMLFLWLAIASNVVVTIDHRFWPIPVGYLCAFLVTCYDLELRYFAMAAGNFTLMCTCIYVWWPEPGAYESGPLSRPKKTPDEAEV